MELSEKIAQVEAELSAAIDRIGPHPLPTTAPLWNAAWRALVAWRRVLLDENVEQFDLEGWTPVFDEGNEQRFWRVNPTWLEATRPAKVAQALITKEQGLGLLR